MPRRVVRALLGLVALAAAPAHGQAPDSGYVVLRAAVHIHTAFSSGRDSLRQVAERAREHGLDALVVSDDDLLEVEYGLFPLRRLLSLRRAEHSLLGADALEAYLEEIRRVDAEFDDLILVDGVESAPYYVWDVDWGAREWTVRNWNKDIVTVGLDDAAAYRSLPILGGEGMWLPRDAGSLLLLWPVAGLAYALWLGRRVHRPVVRGLVGLVCALFLADSAMAGFRRARFTPYQDAGAAPYQALIDAVVARGGLVFWPHPEGASTVPPVSALGGRVRVRSATGRHAQDLVDTRGYTGFAALYADRITATEPGREWDQVLTEYLKGERPRPAWGTGEVDYHEDVVGNRIHDIQTVLWARSASRAGLLEALAAGRCYAVRGGDEALLLRRWSVAAGGVETLSGGECAAGAGSRRAAAVIERVDGAAVDVEVRLVRGDQDGVARVVAEVRGVTPLQVAHVEGGLALGQRCYYRLLAHSRGSMLTANPIFVVGDGP